MQHFARLTARGYVGTPATPAFVFNLSSRRTIEAARKRGKLQGLSVLRGFEQFTQDGSNDADAALTLDYRLLWPYDWHTREAWEGTGKSHLASVPNAFGGSLRAIAYQRQEVNTPAELTSTWSLLPNQPFALRTFLFNPPKLSPGPAGTYADNEPAARWRARFGSGDRRWQFTIVNGAFELARLSSNWTQALQEQLDALEDLGEPTLAQQEQLAELRGPIRREEGGVYSAGAIFESVDSLSLGSPIEQQTGKFYEIVFLPEPRGRLNVILSGSKAQHVELPQVLETGAPGIITGAGPLTVATNGGAFLLQAGRPRFIPIARWLAGPYKMGPWHSSLDQFLTTAQADSAADEYDPTLLGTSVAVESDGLDALTFQFKCSLSTTDSRFTPFLYSVQTSFPALPRPEPGAVAWDSSAHLDGGGNPPILDIDWSCSGPNRRSEAQVSLRDVKGALFAELPEDGYPALENRVASLSYGPSLGAQTPLITGGLVQSSQLANMASSAPGLARADVSHENTQATLQLCDRWALLDEIVLTTPLIGDGLTLGTYLRRLLQNAGESEAQLAGMSPNFGRRLPRAGLGQGPCVVPSVGQSLGDWVRQVLDRWGMGASLILDEAGVWQLGIRSLSLRSTTLHWVEENADGSTGEFTRVIPFEFSSSPARNSATSYPGRFAILSPLDFARDYSEFCNDFRVEGAIDPATGQRLVATWTLHESLSSPSAKNFIGRLKSYPTLRDEGLRTRDDLLYVLRSLVARYGRPGRFVQFETYFLPFLYPGDRVLVDGAPYEIKSLSGGSLHDDRMTIVLQEL